MVFIYGVFISRCSTVKAQVILVRCACRHWYSLEGHYLHSHDPPLPREYAVGFEHSSRGNCVADINSYCSDSSGVEKAPNTLSAQVGERPRSASSMAPAAPPGKPRCMVSEGVGV